MIYTKTQFYLIFYTANVTNITKPHENYYQASLWVNDCDYKIWFPNPFPGLYIRYRFRSMLHPDEYFLV